LNYLFRWLHFLSSYLIIFVLLFVYMVGYIIIGILLWGALGYSMFHFRYNDSSKIDDLRLRYKTTHDGYEAVQHELAELTAQNSILKEKTASLIVQNEDYTKLISELSRYYFHIKQATGKVEELGKLLRIFDTWLDQKLTKVWVDTSWFRANINDWLLTKDSVWSPTTHSNNMQNQQPKFF